MKAYITTTGDPSVGINGDDLTLDGLWDIDQQEDREDVRKALKAMYSDFLGEPAGVRFEDECPECGSRSKTVKVGNHDVYDCTNPHCTLNSPTWAPGIED
jgi:hypothetical protein